MGIDQKHLADLGILYAVNESEPWTPKRQVKEEEDRKSQMKQGLLGYQA